jgi:hypothetical protein
MRRIPAVNCWAIINRPLTRTKRKTFCAKPFATEQNPQVPVYNLFLKFLRFWRYS